ncbi:hypothetical protein [Rhodococcus pyridinivorans]|uniref:Uncharacterized protein n=1 Tax=Rhodococcus pyridinivorans TaxID=103816 RepID=A0A7M2XKU9_9NOCA|nr:hypothetical protein [Rhodococcus pyridinivorans]QOV97611.1 hypothetical protein INP59_16945 [Rhodococcus pyridinivorans]
MTIYAAAALVVAKDKTGQVRYYYEGSVIPYISAEDKKRLLAEGLVVEVDDTELLVDTAAEDPETGGPVTAGIETDGVVARPKQAADKEDWVAYAVYRGMDESEARALTKPQLIASLTE